MYQLDELSTDADLVAIRDWLLVEYEQGDRGFYPNLNIIEDAHRNGQLIVIRNGNDVVAFHFGLLRSPGITEVRKNHRRRGVGRLIVEHCLTLAKADGICVLQIECNPASSVPFWEDAKFRLYDNSPEGRMHGGRAYRMLEYSCDLPTQGKLVNVRVEFFPESRAWKKDTLPFISRDLVGLLTPNEIVHLPERVICFSPSHVPALHDSAVRIEIDGVEILCEKVKYERPQLLGLQSDDCGTHYIERIKCIR